MHDVHNHHGHHELDPMEEPLDAANQSLADSLRASFSVLKGIMAVLVVVYLFSNVKSIESHEEALVLRLGELRRVVNQPGLVWAMPDPMDQIVLLPTRKSNELFVDSHTFFRTAEEQGKPLSFISRSPAQGLSPTRDGALLTADAGLVHTRWKVTYKIDDLRSFVTNLYGSGVGAAESFIRLLVETVGVEVATELTAEEMSRSSFDLVQGEMRRRINVRLTELNAGISVTLVEMVDPTPPIQVRGAFDSTQRAENVKEQTIRAAEQQRAEILSAVAGGAHEKLADIFDAIDRGGTQDQPVEVLKKRMEEILVNEAEGEAGRLIKDAGAYRAVVVSNMQSDVDRYRTLLPEYKRNPKVLLTRLWEQTRQEIFESPGVSKVYRPRGLREFRLKIPLDPEERRTVEEDRLREVQSDLEKIRPTKILPVGPEYD
jgi:membrane protease subunit HflK